MLNKAKECNLKKKKRNGIIIIFIVANLPNLNANEGGSAEAIRGNHLTSS